MAGLLGDVLPWVYSQGDRLKRNVNGLLADPLGSLQQTAGLISDNSNQLQGLLSQAMPDPKQPFNVTDKQALAQAGDQVFNKLLGFAPAGMTKAVGPQSSALETARQNAVKMLGLAENNTAAERAKALGFDTPAVHFSRHGVDARELDSAKFAIAPFDAVGTHVGSPEAALERFNNTVGYKVGNPNYAHDVLAGSSYPVMIKGGNPMLTNGVPSGEQALSEKFSQSADYGNLRDSNAKLRADIFGKYDSIPYVNDVEAAGSISHIVPPQNIRSRFAAFDPARINESDLLGRADLGLLGLLGLGSAGAAYVGSQNK